MKKKNLLGMVLSGAMALTSLQYVAASDIEGHWAQKLILEMQQKGVVSGYADGTFKPDASLTRAEFIAMINKAFGLKGMSDKKFTDVKAGDWFANDVAIAYANGYLKGFPDGSFKPDSVITRAEVATILARIFKLEADEKEADKFKDAHNIPAWAKGSIGALTKLGYFKGYPDGTFGSDKMMTRAEALSPISKSSADYIAKQEEIKKQEEKKKEEAKKKELEKKKKEEEAKKKQAPSGGSGSGGSGSSPSPSPQPQPQPQPFPQPPVEEKKIKSISFNQNNADISAENGEITLNINYDPLDVKDADKGVTWRVTGDTIVTTERSDEHSITLRALDNGHFDVVATLNSNPRIGMSVHGRVSNQVVTLLDTVGTAGDKQITGLASGEKYIVKIDEKYLTVDKHGYLNGQYDSQDQAQIYTSALDNGVTSIQGLDNTKSYQVIQVDDNQRELKDRVESYLAITEQSINFKNMDGIQALGDDLAAKIDAKIQALTEEKTQLEGQGASTVDVDAKLDEWNQLKTQFTQKKTALDAKIEQLDTQLNQKVGEANTEIARITNSSKLEKQAANDIFNKVEAIKREIPFTAFQTVTDMDKYNTFAAEYKKYTHLETQNIQLKADGSVVFDAGNPVQDVSVVVELQKEKNGNYERVTDVNVGLPLIPNQIHAMRKNGVGSYKVKAVVNFVYIANLEKESNVQEVKLLENNLGVLILDANYYIKEANSKVRIIFETGILEWDAIDNATSYDVKVEMSERSQESSTGGMYLEPSGQENDFTNSENEFRSSKLNQNGNWYELNGKESSRVFAATGLSKPQVQLKSFTPFVGNYFSPDAMIAAEQKGDPVTLYLKVWIIPRNEGSLYISDMKTYLGRVSDKSANFIIENAPFTQTLKKLGVIQ